MECSIEENKSISSVEAHAMIEGLTDGQKVELIAFLEKLINERSNTNV